MFLCAFFDISFTIFFYFWLLLFFLSCNHSPLLQPLFFSSFFHPFFILVMLSSHLFSPVVITLATLFFYVRVHKDDPPLSSSPFLQLLYPLLTLYSVTLSVCLSVATTNPSSSLLLLLPLLFQTLRDAKANNIRKQAHVDFKRPSIHLNTQGLTPTKLNTLFLLLHHACLSCLPWIVTMKLTYI